MSGLSVPERTRTTSHGVRRRVLTLTVMAAVAAASGCVSADGTDGPLTALSVPRESSNGAHVPTLTLTQPPPSAASADRPPSSRPDPPESDTPTTEPERAAAMNAAVPVGLRIPSIGVDSELVNLGLQADGSLEVPPSGFPAGWYTGAPTPGELGPAIIAGHVDWGGQPGVFVDLRDLAPGDEIEVSRQDGSTAHFRITRVERFDKDDFPTHAVYGDLDHAGLRLITCDGDFDDQARSYRDNLVVFAELVGPSGR